MSAAAEGPRSGVERELKTCRPTHLPDMVSVECEVFAGAGGGIAVPGWEFIAGKDAVTLARDILALDHEQFSAAFQKSPMKRAKLAGLKRNAAIALENASWGPSP